MQSRPVMMGHNGSLLNGGGSLETVGVDTSKKFGLQLHVVEAEQMVSTHARTHTHTQLPRTGGGDSLVNDGVPVGLDEAGIDVQVGTLVAGSDGSFRVEAAGEKSQQKHSR